MRPIILNEAVNARKEERKRRGKPIVLEIDLPGGRVLEIDALDTDTREELDRKVMSAKSHQMYLEDSGDGKYRGSSGPVPQSKTPKANPRPAPKTKSIGPQFPSQRGAELGATGVRADQRASIEEINARELKATPTEDLIKELARGPDQRTSAKQERYRAVIDELQDRATTAGKNVKLGPLLGVTGGLDIGGVTDAGHLAGLLSGMLLEPAETGASLGKASANGNLDVRDRINILAASPQAGAALGAVGKKVLEKGGELAAKRAAKTGITPPVPKTGTKAALPREAPPMQVAQPAQMPGFTGPGKPKVPSVLDEVLGEPKVQPVEQMPPPAELGMLGGGPVENTPEWWPAVKAKSNGAVIAARVDGGFEFYGDDATIAADIFNVPIVGGKATLRVSDQRMLEGMVGSGHKVGVVDASPTKRAHMTAPDAYQSGYTDRAARTLGMAGIDANVNDLLAMAEEAYQAAKGGAKAKHTRATSVVTKHLEKLGMKTQWNGNDAITASGVGRDLASHVQDFGIRPVAKPTVPTSARYGANYGTPQPGQGQRVGYPTAQPSVLDEVLGNAPENASVRPVQPQQPKRVKITAAEVGNAIRKAPGVQIHYARGNDSVAGWKATQMGNGRVYVEWQAKGAKGAPRDPEALRSALERQGYIVEQNTQGDPSTFFVYKPESRTVDPSMRQAIRDKNAAELTQMAAQNADGGDIRTIEEALLKSDNYERRVDIIVRNPRTPEQQALAEMWQNAQSLQNELNAKRDAADLLASRPVETPQPPAATVEPDAQTVTPTADPTTPTSARQAGINADVDPVAAKNEATAAYRKDLGLDELPEAERQSFQGWLDSAVESGIPSRARAIAREINGDPVKGVPGNPARLLTAEETVGLTARLVDIKNRAKSIQKDPALASELQELIAEGGEITSALKTSGSEVARSMVARQAGLTPDYDIVTMRARAEGLNDGVPLTSKDDIAVTKLSERVIELEEELANVRASVRAEIEAELKATRVRAKGTTAERRTSALRALQSARVPTRETVGAGGGMGSKKRGAIPNPFEDWASDDRVRRAVRQLMRTYYEEGTTKFDDVVARLREDIPGISEDQAYSLMSDKFKKSAIEADVARQAAERFLRGIKRGAEARQKSIAARVGTQTVREISSVERAFQTSFDLGYTTIQGYKALAVNPKSVWHALKESISLIGERNTQEGFDRLWASVSNDPDFARARKAGIQFDEMDTGNEFFGEGMVTKTPGVFKSEAMFKAYKNRLRLSLFKYLSDGMRNDANAMLSIGNMVNVMTGSATGKAGQVARGLGGLGYAPGYEVSKWQYAMFQPVAHAIKNNGVNSPATKRVMSVYAKNAAVMGVAAVAIEKSGIADVEFDPRSTDFGKVTFPNGWQFDLFGKAYSPVKDFGQYIYGSISRSGRYSPPDEFPNSAIKAGTYVEGKMAPFPKTVAAGLSKGTKYNYKKEEEEPITAAGIVYDSLPIGLKSIYENFDKEEGAWNLLLAIELLGVNTGKKKPQFTPRTKKDGGTYSEDLKAIPPKFDPVPPGIRKMMGP